MEWSKLKNIVLLVLLLTNGFLLFFVADREEKSRAQEERTRREAVEFLAQNGIEVSQELVPETMALRPQTAGRDREEENRLAAALLGEETVCQALGGEVYRYLSALGTLQFHRDGAFSGEFAQEAFLQGEGQTPAQHALSVLSGLGFDGEVVAEETGEDAALVTVRQSWQGIPLLNLQVTCVYRSGALVELRGGRRLVGQPTPSGEEAMDVPTALVCFYNGLNALGDVCSQIHTITQGYLASGSLAGAMTLSPAWAITTDTGAYQLNLTAGTLTRVP